MTQINTLNILVNLFLGFLLSIYTYRCLYIIDRYVYKIGIIPSSINCFEICFSHFIMQ